MSSGQVVERVGDEMVLSVRGEATETIDPDVGQLQLTLTATGPGKAEASIEAGRLLDGVLASLAALGGVARTAQTATEPLTWATTSVSSHPDFYVDPATGRQGPTGRTIASAQLEVRVRDFELLDSLQALLDGHSALQLHYVAWSVDSTNPAWPAVRAAAIHDAIRRGRHYAAALGGALLRVEHLADVGLLGGAGQNHAPQLFARQALSGAGAATPAGPHLDPAPQVLAAAIEARFTAGGVSLDGLSDGSGRVAR